MLKKITLGFIFIFIVLSLACAKKEPYQQVSDAFIANYYKQMNQTEALKYTSDLAKDKIQKEIELVRMSRAQNPNFGDNRASVSYSLEEVKMEKDLTFITYKLTIQPKGGAAYDQSSLLTLKNNNGDWKVIDYSELNR